MIRKKSLVILNIGWITFCMTLLFFGDIIPLEFSRPGFAETSHLLMYLSLPVSIIWTCIQVFNIKKSRVAFITFSTLISMMILGVVAIGDSFCGTTSNTLFINKANPSQIIVERNYGCGAYDSDFPKPKFYKMAPLNTYFKYVISIDTSSIDRTSWIRKEQ
jgi:hypothetical protein